MKKNIFIDVTGLSYKHQSGVQNTLWGLFEASKDKEIQDLFNIYYYDCSGSFNKLIYNYSKKNYIIKYHFKNKLLSLIIKKLYDFGLIKFKLIKPKLFLNHVWNWGIKKKDNFNNSITIHDLFPIEYRDLFSNKMYKLTKKSINFAINNCSQIQCVSNYTRTQFLNYTLINPEKVTVVYPPINEYFLNEKIIDFSILSEYNLLKYNYLISIGYLDPRKNLKKQIEAFKKFITDNKTDLKYALTGFKNSFSNEILEILNDPILKDKVIFLGFVDIEKLKCLLTYSSALLYCSIAEGFGIPIIEGFACRTPVITSNTTSMKELGDNRAFLVDPNSVNDIYNSIVEVVENRNKVNFEENYRFASMFTYKNWFYGHFLKEKYSLPK
jgi:glycosyltransferase involved in cell wall biosynthesis